MLGGMRNMFISAVLASIASTATAADRRFTITDFDRVQVDGPFQVVLTTGKSVSATANGSNRATDRVAIEVQGRTLRIRPNRSAWGGYPGEGTGPVTIVLSAPALRAASVTGSGSISIDKVKAMRFEASVSGSGRVAVGSIEADVLNLGLLGSGKITLGGKVKQLRATVQGSGDLDASGLWADDAQVNADTSGNVAVAVRRAAKITSLGSGDTRILGAATCTTTANGSGRVICGSRN